MLYSPVSLVTASRVPCRFGDDTVTVTPGSASPSADVTLPETVPVGIWASIGSAVSRRARPRLRTKALDLIKDSFPRIELSPRRETTGIRQKTGQLSCRVASLSTL